MRRSSTIARLAVAAMAAAVAVTGCSSGLKIVLDSAPPTTTTVAPPTAPAPAVATTARSQPSDSRATPITSSSVDSAPASTTAVDTTLPPLTAQNAPLVTWNGAPRYIHGANLPWYNFGTDFGGGPAGGGASSPESMGAVGAALAEAHGAGMNVVRWWLFPGQPTQFVLDGNGLPTGLQDSVYVDVDAALALGRTAGIAYVFTLFSDPTVLPAAWVTTDIGRQRLADVLGGFMAHYRTDPQIMTWDIVNEPELSIWDGRAQASDVRAFIAAITTAAHASSIAPVTVGGARLDGLPLLTGLELDYYTVHWYDPMKAVDECLACVTYADIRNADKIDKPIVAGEFYVPVGLGDRFALWHAHGYAGALAWSLLPDRTSDRFSIDLDAAAAFAKSVGLT